MIRLLRYRTLVASLVARDLKLKYRGSLLGVCWSLLNPLLLLAVYTVAFSHVMRVDQPNYPAFLLSGLLPWLFFAGALRDATVSVTTQGALLRKLPFPAESLPISTVLFHLAQFGLALLAGIPLSLLAGSRPGWTLALLPALVGLHALFVVGLALLVSALSVPYRDVIHLTEVGLLLLFWLTPVAYPLALAPPALRTLLGLSPITAFSGAYQDLLFFGRAPAGLVWLALLAAAALALALGTLVFRAQAPRFPEVL